MDSMEDTGHTIATGTKCSCPFDRTQVLGRGPVPAPYCLVGEAPGAKEVQQGEPFIGPAGKLLNRILTSAGISRDECYITNTVGCIDLTREIKKPLPAEVDACWPRLEAEIAMVNPQIIICLGNTAQERFFPGLSISRARGKLRMWDNRLVIASYHPARALPHRNPECESLIIEDLIIARKAVEAIKLCGTAAPDGVSEL